MSTADPGRGLAEGPDVVPLREATRTWFAISLQTFGGPAGQIAVMQRTLVDEKRWIGQGRFLHALNYCMLLPGPEAQQLAIYIGWLLNGIRGQRPVGMNERAMVLHVVRDGFLKGRIKPDEINVLHAT